MNIPFDKAVIDIGVLVDGARLVIPAGEENAMRIDRIVSVITGIPISGLHVFTIIKSRQFMHDGRGLIELQ